MENDYDYRKEFQKRAKLDLLQELEVQKRKQKRVWLVVIVLVVVIVLETITFSVIFANSLNGNETDDFAMTEEDITPQDFDVDVGEEYDEEGNIVGIEQNCVSDDGGKFEFTYDKTYKRYDSDGSMIDNGIYDLVNDSLVALKDSEGVKKVLYYDGYDVAEGLSLYHCDGESR